MKHGALLCMYSPVSLLPNFSHVLQFLFWFLPVMEVLKRLSVHPLVHLGILDLAARSVFAITVFSFPLRETWLFPTTWHRELPKPPFIFCVMYTGWTKSGVSTYKMIFIVNWTPFAILYNHVSFIFTMPKLGVAPCFYLGISFCTGLFILESFIQGIM